jgi:hypothetical protein
MYSVYVGYDFEQQKQYKEMHLLRYHVPKTFTCLHS